MTLPKAFKTVKGISSTIGTVTLLYMAVILAGCSTTVNMKERPLFECPNPIIPCKPGSFSESTFDTGTQGYGYYLAIQRVKGLDTEVDEFGVAFAAGYGSGKKGLATLKVADGDRTHDEIHQVNFPRTVEGQLDGRLQSYGFAESVGTPAYSDNTDTLLLSGQFPKTVKGDYDVIASTRKGGDRLGNLLRQNVSSLIHWDAQPALSPDGRSLYFVSAQPDGTGGTDIYVSHLAADGRWSTPQNLGAAVNTPCDELSPFVSGDGKWLYFASSGHSTVGGYDIFRSRLAGGKPGQAENLGLPINTPADELFPSAPSGAQPDTLLYYSSNQRGSKGFDVYVLHRLFRGRPGQQATQEQPDSVTLGGVVRYGDGTPADSAMVTLDQRDPPKRIDSTVSDRDGRYKFRIQEGKKYDITASDIKDSASKELYGKDDIEVPVYNNREEIQRDIFFLDTVVFRVNFPFNNADDPYDYTLDERGFPTDRTWETEIAQAADVLRRIDPASGTRIELVGHTDPIGSDAYNLDLGKRRAEFIRKELVRRGVDPALLIVRSLGEGMPLPSHANEPDEQYRARLRRVELFRK